MSRPATLDEALDDLGRAFRAELLEPILLPIVRWLSRQVVAFKRALGGDV